MILLFLYFKITFFPQKNLKYLYFYKKKKKKKKKKNKKKKKKKKKKIEKLY